MALSKHDTMMCTKLSYCSKHMDTKGEKRGWGGGGAVMNWEIGIDMYTLICIK